MDQQLIFKKNPIPLLILIIGHCLQQLNSLSIIVAVCKQIVNFRWRNVHKYLHLQPRKRPREKKKQVIQKKAKYTDTLTTAELYDIQKHTGLTRKQFNDLFNLIKNDLEKPKKGTKRNATILSPPQRLLMVLHWLRKYLDYHTLSIIYHVSESTISREIRYLLPIMFERFRFMTPLNTNGPKIMGCIGVIDCTPHQRDRVHPRSGDYYRGDKKYFFLTAQIITHLNGTPAEVVVALGHNNDQALFKLSGAKDFVELNQVHLLADRGYSHHRLINSYSKYWTSDCSATRIVVENCISVAKQFKALRARFTQGPELQACAIIIGFELAAYTLKFAPLRYSP